MKRVLSLILVISMMLGMTVLTEAEGNNGDKSQTIPESYSETLSDESAANSGYITIDPPVVDEYDMQIEILSDSPTNARIVKASSSGYYVQCSYTGSLPKVKCATWTEPDDQDDLVWQEMSYIGGGIYEVFVKFSDHGNQKNVNYINHIYAANASGQASGTAAVAFYVKWTGPTISNVKYLDLDSSGFTIQCDVTDSAGVDNVRFPTWREGQKGDNAIWHKAVKVGNTDTYL